jgi:hypothetical protein
MTAPLRSASMKFAAIPSATMADAPKRHQPSSSRAEETGDALTPPRAQISRSSRFSSRSSQPLDINGLSQLQPNGIERRGSTDGFSTLASAQSSIGLYGSSSRSFLDVSGRLSDNPIALETLLGPGDQQLRSITTGLTVPPPPPTEANAWGLAASDPWFDADVRPHEDSTRATTQRPVDRDDSEAPPSDEEGTVMAGTSCPRRRHLRHTLLRTLESVLDMLTDPDDEPNPSAWMQ